MSDRFPGLGSDPAPGDPEQVRRCGREYARAAVELDALAAEVARLAQATGSWRGAAASAFTAALSPLPGHLGTAASSCAAVAARLRVWAAELDELQGQARALERAARDALERMQAAHARIAPGLTPTDALGLSAPGADDLAAAERELRRLAARADDLHLRWQEAGRSAASAVDAATAHAPALPRNLATFVWEHRDGIALLANGAALLSGPAVVVPVAGPALSLGLTAAAATGHTALAVHADGSTADVVLGAVGVGLGGGAVAVGRVAGGPVAAPVAAVVQRALDRAGITTWGVGTARTLRGTGQTPPPAAPPPSAPRPPAPPPSRSTGPSSPALRQLLVAPVTGAPRTPPGPTPATPAPATTTRPGRGAAR